jgi:hypothetical protein
MAESLVHDTAPPSERSARGLPDHVVPWVVAGETVLALVLGLIALGRPQFYPDEAYTWSSVDRSLGSMLSVIVREEAFQVLHTLVLWPVNAISDTSFALRLPSVLCFAATVPAVWLLTRRLFGEPAGWVAGLLLALNGFALEYAQEARSYTMAMMLVAWAGVGLEREVNAPTRGSRRLWMIASVLAVWAHGMAVLAIAAQIGVTLLLPAERLREMRRRLFRDAVVIGVLVAPVVLAPSLQVDHAESYAGEHAPNFETLRLAAWGFAGRSVFALVVYAVGGAVALWAGVQVFRSERWSLGTWRYAFLVAWLVVPAAVLLGVSFAEPIWVPRYAIASLVPLVALVAYGLTRVRATAAFAGVLTVAVVCAGYGVVRWYQQDDFASFDAIAHEIEVQHRPGDAIALATDRSRVPFEFELRHRAALRREVPSAYPTVPWGGFGVGDQTGDTMPETAVRAMAAKYGRIWVISGFYDPDDQKDTVLDRMRTEYRLVRAQKFDGKIDLYLFERAGP